MERSCTKQIVSHETDQGLPMVLPSVFWKKLLWRIRPLAERLLEGCRKLPREECLSVDEQMIPFTGKTQLKQFVPRKPNPVGLKNFVLAAPDGLVLDFEIYQGKKTLLFPGCSGIAESAVMRLSQSLSPGTKLFFDRYFTSSSLLDRLVDKGIGATGPIMNNELRSCRHNMENSHWTHAAGGRQKKKST
ncbi:hypothetical protein HPB48_024552 [Haemaphysalis longicornis]|uniref:PiggyBac transposable element-derived protein domain-containing protein n=1 Tax=Haemaphysalis longicornis TaxID=44386 RepID=A0A9J6H8P8_HAELO|nr:hypothetical protein HPB48_024552 [Haemaphysalis longicornis]